MKRWCCYCDEIHDIAVKIEDEPEQAEPSKEKRASDIVQVPAERYATRINVESTYHTHYSNAPNVKTTFQDLERLQNVSSHPCGRPAACHEGVRKARTEEPREMKKALVLLRRAKEIYGDNERPVAAAYAAVVMAEIYMKRGEPEKAKVELEFAEPRLTEEDIHAKRRAGEILAKLEGSK